MSESSKMFEEALESLRDENRKLKEGLDTQIHYNVVFTNTLNEALKYIEKINYSDFRNLTNQLKKNLKKPRE